MNTKYGNVSDIIYEKYKTRLINSIYKILPMKEEEVKTLNVYIESLVYELIGLEKVIIQNSKDGGEIMMIISTLENLINEEDIKVVKREVFRMIEMIKRM